MDLLTIVQTAANELGLTAPTTVAQNTDPQVVQLMALTNRDCVGLYRGYDWTDLQIPFIVNVEEPITVTGDITNGSAIITNLTSTAGLDKNYAISATGAPQAQRVAEVLSSTSVRCEMLNTADETGTDVVFARDTFDLPTDFDRYIGQTWWDRSNFWRLIGPDSPQMDEYIRSGIFATGPRRRWRQIGRRPAAWRIWPPPFAGGAPAPGALVFEYISKNWVVGADDETKPLFTADTDEPLVDDQLVIMGVKWRMWQIKGFDYAALQQEYIDAVSAKFATDGGIPDLYLNRRTGPFLISSANVQDGFWPGPGNP
jgi:hypothetical protein